MDYVSYSVDIVYRYRIFIYKYRVFIYRYRIFIHRYKIFIHRCLRVSHKTSLRYPLDTSILIKYLVTS